MSSGLPSTGLQRQDVGSAAIDTASQIAVTEGAVAGAVGSLVAAGALPVGTTVATLVNTAIVAAGASAVSVPVAGLIAAGIIMLIVGGICLAKALISGKVHRDEMVALATQMGMSDADEVPSFTAKVFDLAADGNLTKLHDLADKYYEKASKDIAKGNTDSNDVTRAGIVGGVLLSLDDEYRADGMAAMMRTVSAVRENYYAELREAGVMAQIQYRMMNIEPSSDTEDVVPYVVGGVVVGAVILGALVLLGAIPSRRR